MTLWERDKVATFLQELADAGGYASVNEMMRKLDLDPSTARKWSSARPRKDRTPKAFESLLRKFAEHHRYDAGALLEQWELRSRPKAAEQSSTDEPAELGRAIDMLRDIFYAPDRKWWNGIIVNLEAISSAARGPTAREAASGGERKRARGGGRQQAAG